MIEGIENDLWIVFYCNFDKNLIFKIMTQLIFKDDLEKNKLEALLDFLKTWDIDAELKINTPKIRRKENEFSLSTGIWKDYNVDAKDLREKAWKR